MLIGVDPLLGPDLLHALRAMGHGDVLALVDRNFPAVSHAQRLVRLDGTGTVRAAAAILTVLPVDTFVEPAVSRMEVVGDPAATLPVHHEFKDELDRACGRDVPVTGVERFEFYRRAKEAFVTVVTGEDRPYGDFLIVKGVVTG